MIDKNNVVEELKCLESYLFTEYRMTDTETSRQTYDYFTAVSDAIDLLKEQPEITRCKDCIQNNQCSIQFKFADADNQDEWFCAYGRRKDE